VQEKLAKRGNMARAQEWRVRYRALVDEIHRINLEQRARSKRQRGAA
jgi:hypothetical protein